MRNELVKAFIEKIPFSPFKIISKKGTVMTVLEVIEYSDSDFKFKDIKGNTVVQDFEGIDNISERGEDLW